MIDFSKRVDDSFYYTEDKYKFYNLLKESIVKSDTIYQWRRKYVRENKSNVSPTLTANMGTGGHNVPLILSKIWQENSRLENVLRYKVFLNHLNCPI